MNSQMKIKINLNHIHHPTSTIIIHPSLQLSNNPSQLSSIIVILSPASVATMMSQCRSFSVTDTTTNCPGLIVVMSTLSLGSYTSDTYLRLYDPSTGDQLTYNDDCNDRLCSKIQYTFTTSFRAYIATVQSSTCVSPLSYVP